MYYTTQQQLHMIFGSTSDKEKVMPGIEAFVKDHPDIGIYVHWASADNTPEKVKELIRSLLADKDRSPLPLVSGAGMSNVLTGVIKTYANIDDLVIGVPISDSITDGLSSVLSTSEKPPRNPVLVTSIDGTYAAANIALRFIKGSFDSVVLVTPESPTGPDYRQDQKILEEIQQLCEKYGLPTEAKRYCDIHPDDLVLNTFYADRSHFGGQDLKPIDVILKQGNGIQVAVMNDAGFHPDHYRDLFFAQDYSSTAFVTAGLYINAVIAAIQIMGHEEGLFKLVGEKAAKSEKLADEPAWLVTSQGTEFVPYEKR